MVRKSVDGHLIDEDSQIILQVLRQRGEPMSTGDLRRQSTLERNEQVRYRLNEHLVPLSFVEQCGSESMPGQTKDALLWQITDAGRNHLNEIDDEIKNALDAEQAIETVNSLQDTIDEYSRKLEEWDRQMNQWQQTMNRRSRELSREKQKIEEARQEAIESSDEAWNRAQTAYHRIDDVRSDLDDLEIKIEQQADMLSDMRANYSELSSSYSKLEGRIESLESNRISARKDRQSNRRLIMDLESRIEELEHSNSLWPWD